MFDYRQVRESVKTAPRLRPIGADGLPARPRYRESVPETRIEWGILGVGLVLLLGLGAAIGLHLRDDDPASTQAQSATIVRSTSAAPLTPPTATTTGRASTTARSAGAPTTPKPAAKPKPAGTTTTETKTTQTTTTKTAPSRLVSHPAAVRLRLSATRGDSWLEVRSGSSAGTVLFSGTLAHGSTRTFRAPQLWVRFGGASNLDARLNGHALALRFGTYDTLVTPSGLAPPS
jgi:RodZ C-terminal domain